MGYKVVINTCYGGFHLSIKTEKLFWERKLEKEIFVYKYNSETENFTKVSDLSQLSEWNAHFTEIDFGENPDNIEELSTYRIERHDPILVQVVEEFGAEASGESARLKVKEIPCPMYKILDYDGAETIRVPFEEDDWTVIKEKRWFH